MIHVISWSGGKDSTATVILMKQHLKELTAPGDQVVILFSEVMFDLKNNISGINPDVINFIKNAAQVFSSWGFSVEILHAKKDFLDVFFHKLKRSPDPNRIGMTHGFVPSKICAVKRDCKLQPITDWYKAHKDESLIGYQGIAVDESERLISMHKKENTISLLEKYNFTEKDARELCEKYNLLSPQYSLNNGKQTRDGCWFCPNAKLCEHEAIFKHNPEAWNKYVSLENIPNLAYPKWSRYTKQTLKERDELIKQNVLRDCF